MEERRSRISLSISGEATYKTVDSSFPPVDVMVSEISKTGLRFITSELLEPRTLIDITINITSISDPIKAVAHVLWQRKLSSRFLLDTAAKFIKINNENSNRLIKYIYEYAASSVISREYVRCSLITEIDCINIGEHGEKRKCLSADIGVKGMKLFVDDMPEVGREMLLTFKLPDRHSEELALKGKVVWCRKGAVNVCGLRFEDLSDRDLKRIISYVESKLSKNS